MNGCPYCKRTRSELRMRGHSTTCAIRRHPSGIVVSKVEVGVDFSKCPIHGDEERWDCWACEHHSDELRGT